MSLEELETSSAKTSQLYSIRQFFLKKRAWLCGRIDHQNQYRWPCSSDRWESTIGGAAAWRQQDDWVIDRKASTIQELFRQGHFFFFLLF